MLVTLAQAKRHLRVDFSDEDADIELRTAAASAAVVRYLKAASPYELDSSGAVVTDSAGDPVVLFEAQAATLLMLGYLYKDRDGDPDQAYQMGYLPAPVTALLYAIRDPALA